jgi:hypothetical protein
MNSRAVRCDICGKFIQPKDLKPIDEEEDPICKRCQILHNIPEKRNAHCE